MTFRLWRCLYNRPSSVQELLSELTINEPPGGGEEGGCREQAELLGRILSQLGLGPGRVGSPSSRGRGEQDQTQLEARQRVTAGHHTWPDYVLLCPFMSIYLSLCPIVSKCLFVVFVYLSPLVLLCAFISPCF